MAIEIRDDDVMMMKKLGEITDMKTLLTVATERAFMRTLDGGCSTPVGCNAVFKDGKVIISFKCFVIKIYVEWKKKDSWIRVFAIKVVHCPLSFRTNPNVS